MSAEQGATTIIPALGEAATNIVPSTVDPKEWEEWCALDKTVQSYWSNEIHTILEQGNPELLESLYKVGAEIDKLLVIRKKTKNLKKVWSETMRMYARLANQCITYSRRHLS